MKFIFVPLIIFLIIEIFSLSSFWQSLEHKAQDIFFVLRGEREISENVVIVEIGDETFNTLNERWPFPREYHARLIENLERAGVKEIVFDIEFTESSQAEADELLAATAGKYKNILLAGKLIKTIYDSSTREQFLSPIKPFLQRNIKWGTVNITADEDGFVRKYDILQKRKDESKAAIGLLALADIYGIDTSGDRFRDFPGYFQLGDNYIPKIDKNSVLLNYFGQTRHFPYYDYAAILDDSTFTTAFENQLNSPLNEFDEILKKNELQNKIVLVGLTEVEFHDLHHTRLPDQVFLLAFPADNPAVWHRHFYRKLSSETLLLFRTQSPSDHSLHRSCLLSFCRTKSADSGSGNSCSDHHFLHHRIGVPLYKDCPRKEIY